MEMRNFGPSNPHQVTSLVEGPFFGCEGHVIINCRDHIGIASQTGERNFIKIVHDPNVCIWNDLTIGDS